MKEEWERLQSKGFDCLNTSNYEEACEMLEAHAIRFAKNHPIPNIEFKKIKTDLDNYALKNKLKVILDKNTLYISPLEVQIAYKLFLGSGKDLEDAKHLYDLFKENLNKEELSYFINKLNVKNNFKIISENGNEIGFKRLE